VAEPGGGPLVAVRARPDQLQAVFAFDFRQRGVDRSGEARIVQLDREVVAALFGGLLPGGAELDVAGVDAEVRAFVGRVFDAGDAGLDVEGQRADRAGEAVFGGGEGAEVPFAVSGRSIAASYEKPLVKLLVRAASGEFS
jgi:hypothetical protein